ncbi:MAG TPA: periplasmic heavy metal sensor [Acetobacteraceae bacterium]|nr:periplasmic heavy metal sensor [Acetobacteraceae bacterium]
MTQQRAGWRRIALPISIVLNLFFVALIGGHLWQVHRAAVNFGEPLMRALARAEASLPPRDAAAFGTVIKRNAPQYVPSLRQLTAARRALQDDIVAQHYDPAAVEQALSAWQGAWNRFFGDFDHTLVDALAQVSPEGRRKLIATRRSEHEESKTQ